MIISKLRAIALSIILCLLVVPSLSAQPNAVQQRWPSTQQFRAEYLRFIDAISARVPTSDQSLWAEDVRQRMSNLRQQVITLPDASLNALANAHNRQTFSNMVEQMTVRNGYSPAARSKIQSAIVPPDYSGAVVGTTCSTTPTDAATLDGEKIGLYVDVGVQVPLDYACETIVEILGEGTNAPFCIAAGIAKAVEVVLDSLLNHQEFCNGLLDGAKIDAALADVVNVHGDVASLDTHLTNVNNQITSEFSALDTHLTNVDNHTTAEFIALDTHLVSLVSQLSSQVANLQALLSTQLKEIMKLELTPDGLRQVPAAILTCTGANCPSVLANCPGGVCRWNNVGP